jgi:uncharacterized protein (TIGR02145 family)
MKKLSKLFALLLISFKLLAQAPQKMSYQAVIRNSANNLLTNAPIKMRISILQGSATGTSVYSELHSATTNTHGLVTIEIGAGTSPTGNFSTINWGNGLYYLKTETDPNNGTNYTISGTTQLLSVPYALHSGNGLLKISITGDTMFLGDGTKVVVPGISLANNKSFHTCGADSVHNASLNYNTMKDQEGNIYKTIQVGSQTWMAENLKAVTYLNGDSIVNITNNATWAGMGIGAYSYNNNNASNNCPYGKLYNWFAVNDNRKLCPSGWHVPSDLEWNSLISVLDGSFNPTAIGIQSTLAGNKMKSTGIQFWVSPNSGANNESGFSALPGGYRKADGIYASLRTEGYWWTSSAFDNDNALRRGISNFLFRDSANKKIGFSVRCVKD